jgi:hypothetical protein
VQRKKLLLPKIAAFLMGVTGGFYLCIFMQQNVVSSVDNLLIVLKIKEIFCKMPHKTG